MVNMIYQLVHWCTFIFGIYIEIQQFLRTQQNLTRTDFYPRTSKIEIHTRTYHLVPGLEIALVSKLINFIFWFNISRSAVVVSCFNKYLINFSASSIQCSTFNFFSKNKYNIKYLIIITLFYFNWICTNKEIICKYYEQYYSFVYGSYNILF